MIIGAIVRMCLADAFVGAPTRAPVGGPADTSSVFPFLVKQMLLSSMRYQQIYAASSFTNVPKECTYITTLTFLGDDFQTYAPRWTVTNMQINLSTTVRTVDNLSTNFVENVGADDTVVFGPSSHEFFNVVQRNVYLILLDRPFRYNPADGNLLLDIRIFNGSGPLDLDFPTMDAQNSSTDGVSVVYATNVAATAATTVSTAGLFTVIQFSAIPSLVIYTTGTTNTPTDYIVIDWPSQPSVFRLQKSSKLGTDAIWQTVTSTTGPRYFFPVESAGSAGFFRLVWESSQAVQPATVPIMRATAQGLPGVK